MEGAVAFLPGGFFHVYNHANGDENLFRTPDNYAYFLRKYGEYLGPVVDTFAYCLMPNHFHLMVRVKPQDEVLRYLLMERRMTVPGIRQAGLNPSEGLQPLGGFRDGSLSEWLQALGEVEPMKTASQLLSKQFSHFFNAYTQALNKQQGRTGSLFSPNLRRKPIPDEQYFTRLIAYIHQNPAHHGFTTDFRTWPHSSYQALLSERPTRLCRAEVLDWFGNRAQFVRAHAAAGP